MLRMSIIALMSLCCVLLAAGASRRLGHPKQLVRVHGETLLARSVRLALAAELASICVVLGAHADTIAPALAEYAWQPAITVLHNLDWEQGIATSIRTGIAYASEVASCDGSLLMACDQPFLSVEHLRALGAAFDQHRQQRIIASRYAETAGIPAVFPRSSFPALLALEGDQGARQLLRTATVPPVFVDCEAAAFDLDTAEEELRLAADSLWE